MRRAAILLLVLLAAGCATPPALHDASSPPPGRDTTLVRNDCLACHTTDMVAQQRLTEKQWTKTVDKMRTWGAPTEDENVEPLLGELVATHPGPADNGQDRMLAAKDAAALFIREPDGRFADGDAGRGEPIYVARCAPCHGADGRGAKMGVALAGRHILDRAARFATIVRAGSGRMPGYEQTTDIEVADLLAYLRSLPAW